MAPRPVKAQRKQFSLDAAVVAALSAYGRDAGCTLDSLADEAFRDLLKKHGRPLNLKEALRASTRAMPANDPNAKPEPAGPPKRSVRNVRERPWRNL